MPLAAHVNLHRLMGSRRIIIAGRSTGGHRHPLVTIPGSELPTLTAVSTLGDDRTPSVLSRLALGHDQQGVSFQAIVGATVRHGDRQIIIGERYSRQAILGIGLEMGFATGSPDVGDPGMALLIGLVGPEQDSVIVRRRGNHEGWVGDVISNVTASTVVDRGHVGLGKLDVVNAQIIDFTVHAVVVVDSLGSPNVKPLVYRTDLSSRIGLGSFEDTVYVNFLRAHVVGTHHVLPSTGHGRTGSTAYAV